MLFASLPFADPEIKDMSRNFHDAFAGPFDHPIAYMILGCMILSVAVAAYVYKKKNEKIQRKTYHDMPGLLKELCHAHKLNKLEIMAVKDLAEVRGITPTANIFLQVHAWNILPGESRLQNYRTVLANVKNRVFVK